MTLPTPDEVLTNTEMALRRANVALADARDWLASDWTPVGSTLTEEQAARRAFLRKAVNEAKGAIGGALHR